MRRRTAFAFLAAVGAFGPATADEVRLVNGDEINGTVTALTQTELTLQSENFGTLTIPRDKVRLIGLGAEGLPEPPAAASVPATGPMSGGLPGGLSGQALQQMLGDPAVQQQFGGLLGEALGGRSLSEVQGDLQDSRRQLKELGDDIGGIEGEAINSYLRIFDVLGGGLDAAGSVTPRSRPPQSRPPRSTPPQPNTAPGEQTPATDPPAADPPAADGRPS